MRVCKVADCANKHKGHGYCSTHYQRWLRNGDAIHLVRNPLPPRCIVEDCDGVPDALSRCQRHYVQHRKANA